MNGTIARLEQFSEQDTRELGQREDLGPLLRAQLQTGSRVWGALPARPGPRPVGGRGNCGAEAELAKVGETLRTSVLEAGRGEG